MVTLERKQFLPISPKEAWAFFATPENLNKITPDSMSFEILSDVPPQMYPGLMIQYRIRPFLNIPFRWCTEITHVQSGAYFVDEQRMGPYNIWHHEHHFEAAPGGVIMTDKLTYDIGKSFLGWLAGILFVHQQVRNIFDFRYKKLEEIFAK